MKSYNEVLSDVTKTATKIPQSNYLKDGKYRIFDQGKEYSVGFSNDEQGVATDYPYIIFGDHTRIVKYVDEPCYIGADGVKLLKVINKDFNPRFVYYNILAKPIESQGYARHFKFVKEIQFTEKPLSTQKNIVTELDKIQSAIDNKKQQLSLLDEAVKSKFVEMFGENPVESGKWKVERLGNLCTITSGGTPDRKNEEYWKNGTIPWIKTTELKNNELSIVEEYITEKGLDESAAKIVPEETILLAMYGQGKTRGMTAFLKIQASTNQACACILPTESKELSQRFIWYFLIMNYENVRNLAVGCNQLNLNSSLVKNIEIPVPPLDLQNQFAAFVQKIDKAKSIAKQQIADLQELLDSKMQEYFG